MVNLIYSRQNHLAIILSVITACKFYFFQKKKLFVNLYIPSNIFTRWSSFIYPNSRILIENPWLAWKYYCIWRVSETTRASSDVYCQSYNDDNTRTSCAFYEKSLQVNHRQNTQKERARYCGVGREGEGRDRGRGYSVCFYGGQLFLVLTIILNQQEIFWDITTGHIYTKLFRDAYKYCNRCLDLFSVSSSFSGATTYVHITLTFSTISSKWSLNFTNFSILENVFLPLAE
jgi:hypothetical protein